MTKNSLWIKQTFQRSRWSCSSKVWLQRPWPGMKLRPAPCSRFCRKKQIRKNKRSEMTFFTRTSRYLLRRVTGRLEQTMKLNTPRISDAKTTRRLGCSPIWRWCHTLQVLPIYYYYICLAIRQFCTVFNVIGDICRFPGLKVPFNWWRTFASFYDCIFRKYNNAECNCHPRIHSSMKKAIWRIAATNFDLKLWFSEYEKGFVLIFGLYAGKSATKNDGEALTRAVTSVNNSSHYLSPKMKGGSRLLRSLKKCKHCA